MAQDQWVPQRQAEPRNVVPQRQVNDQSTRVCGRCGGSGHSSFACGMCNGTGFGPTGSTACFFCRGSRFEKCPGCNGTGRGQKY
jgi:hypothetical protein